MNTLATRQNRSSYDGRQTARANAVEFKLDPAIQKHIKELSRSRQQLESINKVIRKSLGCELGWGHRIFGRTFGMIVPRKAYGAVPSALLKWVAEEADILEQLEGMMRECHNNSQEAVVNIVSCAMAESAELEELVSNLETAEGEGWSARELQEFMDSESGLTVAPVISDLLDTKFSVLTDEQKEENRKKLLEQLKIMVLTRKKLIETLGNTCDAGLEQINVMRSQYYAYTRVYRPIAVIRNAAKDMLQTDQSLYAAREALRATIVASVGAIENIIRSAGAVNDYHIASTEFHQVMDESNGRISTGLANLKQIEEGRRRAAIEGRTNTRPMRQLVGSTTGPAVKVKQEVSN